MANYDHKASLFLGALGTKAMQRLVTQDCKDLFLSLDEEQATSAIVSFLRLNMDTIPEEKTAEGVLATYKRILGYLLFSKKVALAQYGLSAAGKAQFDALVALVHKPAQAEDPKITEYQQFNASADAVEYQLRIVADKEFREWATQE